MKPEIVEELARALAIEDGTSPDEPVAPYDKRLGWELYKSSVRAIAPIIDRLVSEARETEQRALRNILALARKRQAEGGPDGNLATIEGFALAGLKGSDHA